MYEDHIWSGSINDPSNKNCPGVLPKVREAIWKDDLYTAQSTVDASCMATPLKQQVFQTAGNLTLAFPSVASSSISAYNHSLDLATAIATTTYTTQDGVLFTRTSFASHPDNVIVMKISANVSGKVGFEAKFTTPMDNPKFSVNKSSLSLTARGTTMYTLPGSIEFLARAEISAVGGSVQPGRNGDTLSVSGADLAVIKIAIDTNYMRYDDISGNPEAKVSETLAAVRNKTWQGLRDAHVDDHAGLFGRVDITLGTPTQYSYLPTNFRKNLPGGADADADLFALYVQYGRYLGIASSRKTEPSNLQGIWNQETNPAWGSKYTLNINQQMNSWLSEPLNIAETLDPLWNLISEMAERGTVTAVEEYNITRGWVGHHNTGIWRDSTPIDAAFYGMWPMAPAWLMQNAYEHYAFEPNNIDWVKNVAYPLMKGLCEFYLDFVVVTPKDVEPQEYIVTNPSMSPEKGIGDYNDTNVSLTYGSTIDNSLLRDLFNHTTEFANLLDVDAEFAENLTATMGRLMPLSIGSEGQIREWARDYNPGGVFTHISHMYPLFPSAQIDPRLNSTLARAANVSLMLRGDSGNGWPTAWRANCFARLLDGEKAYYYMKRLLNSFSYDNLWSKNSVFQIDANFGGANAVAEMILQSHNGEVHLLPAIPSAWASGRVKGFRVRGGFTVDMGWSGGKLEEVVFRSTSGTGANVRYNDKVVPLELLKGGQRTLGILDFEAEHISKMSVLT
ncbi:hypothetical protein E1B28_006194 [Marasmius oreades]|uniref:Glycosyl hydrolase family 95 N-terminal domain-containing protein n=1 Tax=Marasmius oreades TaxID=181124 RepID=A0A9P7UWC2_9AGAR|nr:uncharacterized protein E1B28_006194 [Marasmius oreades]KAG7095449.1 hypothetical protein E1B28_006194 [Marasmius oreades]